MNSAPTLSVHSNSSAAPPTAAAITNDVLPPEAQIESGSITVILTVTAIGLSLIATAPATGILIAALSLVATLLPVFLPDETWEPITNNLAKSIPDLINDALLKEAILQANIRRKIHEFEDKHIQHLPVQKAHTLLLDSARLIPNDQSYHLIDGLFSTELLSYSIDGYNVAYSGGITRESVPSDSDDIVLRKTFPIPISDKCFCLHGSYWNGLIRAPGGNF